MDLAVFSFVTLLVAGVFAALRPLTLAAARGWRWAGWAAGIVCGCALVVFAMGELLHAGLLMSFRVMGSEPYLTADGLAGVAAFQDLRSGGSVLFATLGLLQGTALGLALSVITEPSAPLRFEAWRSALGKAIVMLPLPALTAVLLTFYQDNRERFSSVEVGSFLRLVLNPAPVSGSQQSTQQGASGGGRLFPTGTFVDRALESLSGPLRRKDLAFVAALKDLGTEGRVPTEVDSENTASLERTYCGLLGNLPSYIRHFDDYNLLTLDIGEPLIRLQVGWELDTRELKGWLDAIKKDGLAVPKPGKINPDSASYYMHADNAFAKLDEIARRSLRQVGEQVSPDTPSNLPCRKLAESKPARPARGEFQRVESRAPAAGSEPLSRSTADSIENNDANPNQQNDEMVGNRIIDLHAPYRAIGIASFYAAIGSFETAYLVLQRWLALDSQLRAKEIKLHDALPRWFRLRVISEAALMYKNTSPEARLSERSEAGGLPAPDRTAPDDVKANSYIEIDPRTALMLGRVSSEIEFFEVSGLTGAISQRHVEEAKTLTRYDFRCFEDAFEPTTQLAWIRHDECRPRRSR